MCPRPDVSDERRDQIVQAALQVFCSRGLRSARMEDVAQAAGLSVGGVYWYYKSKAEIIGDLLQRLYGRDVLALSTMLERPGPVRDRLLAVVQKLMRLYRELEPYHALILEFHSLSIYDEQVRDQMRQVLTSARSTVAGLIRQGIDRGEMVEVDPQAAANVFLGMFEGLGLLNAVDPAGTDYAVSLDKGINGMLNSLSRPAGDPGTGNAGRAESGKGAS